jgi:L-fucose isomerase-like protein
MKFGQPKEPVNLWGHVRTREDIERERAIIEKELKEFKEKSDVEVEFTGGDIVSTEMEVFKLSKELSDADAILVYGTCNFANILEAVGAFNKPTIIFIKVYRGKCLYSQAEVVNPRFIRGETDEVLVKDSDVFVVFDDYEKLLKLIRAMNAIKQLHRTHTLCIGTPYGWQMRYREVRQAQRKLGLKVSYVTYGEFASLIKKASKNKEVRNRARELAENMSKKALGIIEPSKDDIVKSMIAYLVLKKLINKRKANSVTVSGCFLEYLAITGTPACMNLSILNDEGIVAGCEGDFACHSGQLLLSYVSNKPVAFYDPIVHPDANKIILAHCTSPLKMRGFDKDEEKFIIRSQDSSNRGVAVQVKYSEGQEVTIVSTAFEVDKMVITKGKIMRSPEYPICRSQVEVKVKDSKKVYENWVGFHMAMGYGDYIEEMENACRILKIQCIVL